MLLARGRGFEMPRRLGLDGFSLMRCIASERALEIMCSGCKQGGLRKSLAEQDDSLRHCRVIAWRSNRTALTLKAAYMMGHCGEQAARAEIAMIKWWRLTWLCAYWIGRFPGPRSPGVFQIFMAASWRCLGRYDGPMGRMKSRGIDCEGDWVMQEDRRTQVSQY